MIGSPDTPLLSIRVKNFKDPIYVEDKQALTLREKKDILKQTKKAVEVFSDRDYDFYSKRFNFTYNTMCDTLTRHLLEIRKIENEAIVRGDSKDEVLAASNAYAQSVIDNQFK